MYTRSLAPPSTHFFLFGPRGTGKSTWLDAHFPTALRFDFLKNDVLLRYMASPSRFRTEIQGIPRGSWVVLDEVQKVPSLLDEVQSLMHDRQYEILFCMTGSSARKLRSQQANLLAGRAVQRFFFPLTSRELAGDFDLERCLRFGTLPLVCAKPEWAVQTLDAYVGTYLKEEIQQESLVRNLEPFARFLKMAALFNGQVVNVAGLSRDAGVARPSVERYFSILTDTLIGSWVPGWQPRLKVREKLSPKYYFFDCGVVRALLGRTRDPLESEERGGLFETWVFNELRAATHFLDVGGDLSYYRTPAGVEVDFIWSRGNKAIGVEVKSSTEWKPEYGRGLLDLLAQGKIQSAHGVYRGDRPFKMGPIQIWPYLEFSKRLFDGSLFPTSAV